MEEFCTCSQCSHLNIFITFPPMERIRESSDAVRFYFTHQFPSEPEFSFVETSVFALIMVARNVAPGHAHDSLVYTKRQIPRLNTLFYS